MAISSWFAYFGCVSTGLSQAPVIVSANTLRNITTFCIDTRDLEKKVTFPMITTDVGNCDPWNNHICYDYSGF